MSELQAVEPAEVLVPLDRAAAEKLDGRIRRLAKQAGDQLVQVGRLLDEAKAGRIHEALGHSSWTAYVADSLGGTLQLSGAARQAMVELMAGEGMSVRAIAAATGVSKSTVDRDIAQVSQTGTLDSEGAPDSTVPQRDSSQSGVIEDAQPKPHTSVGLDGKTRRKPQRKPRPKTEPKAKPEPEPVKAERKVQIPTAYRESIKTLSTVSVSMRDLVDDPRWFKARDRFTDKDRVELDGNIAVLQTLRAAMGERCDVAPKRHDPCEEKTA